MVSPTVPVLFERGLKNAQVLGEFTPCKYSLVGWQQSVLVYQALCNNQSTFFVFDPYSNSVSVSNAPTVDKMQTNAVAHTEVLDWFRDPSVFPAEVELASRELSLRGSAMMSPDGKWLAIVARYIYGPEDVLLVAPQDLLAKD